MSDGLVMVEQIAINAGVSWQQARNLAFRMGLNMPLVYKEKICINGVRRRINYAHLSEKDAEVLYQAIKNRGLRASKKYFHDLKKIKGHTLLSDLAHELCVTTGHLNTFAKRLNIKVKSVKSGGENVYHITEDEANNIRESLGLATIDKGIFDGDEPIDAFEQMQVKNLLALANKHCGGFFTAQNIYQKVGCTRAMSFKLEKILNNQLG
jgi:hypothetical protein